MGPATLSMVASIDRDAPAFEKLSASENPLGHLVGERPPVRVTQHLVISAWALTPRLVETCRPIEERAARRELGHAVFRSECLVEREPQFARAPEKTLLSELRLPKPS